MLHSYVSTPLTHYMFFSLLLLLGCSSSPTKVAQTVDPVTNVADNGDGRDIRVSFTKSADETEVREYRLMIRKTVNASSFDLAGANAVIVANYTTITPTGSDISLTLPANARDIQGNSISNDIQYRVFVLTVANGSNIELNELSAASNTITLTFAVAPVVTSVTASDVAENGNGGDLQVSFVRPADESAVNEYRIIVVKLQGSAGFDLSSANSIAAANFIRVSKTGNNIQVALPEDSRDRDGELIQNDVSYFVFVLTIADGLNATVNALSLRSNAITLTFPTAPAVTNVRAFDVTNHGNGLDLQVSFNVPADESETLEYRVLVVQSTVKTNFDLDAALAAGSDRVFVMSPDGLNKLTVLNANSLDTNGDLITEGLSYSVFVLSVARDIGVFSTLSVASQEITLVKTNEVMTLTDLPAATGGVDVDAQGNVYVTDIGAAPTRRGQTVYKVTPEGVFSIFAQGGGLLGASGNEFDSNGDLFQANIRGNSISKISPSGVESTFIASGLASPVGITIDAGDTLYVANCGNNTIQKISPSGVINQFASSSLLSCPNGIVLADDGNFYVANFNDGRILKITKQGVVTLFATLPGANNGHIVFRDGLFYVAARGAHRIFKINMSGEISVFAGTGVRGHSDGTALQATFSLPNDLAFSPAGDILYINEVEPTFGSANIPSKVRMILIQN